MCWYAFEGGGDPFSTGPKTSRLSRFNVDPSNPDTALPNSEVVILGKVDVPPCDSWGPGADCLPTDHSAHAIGTVRVAPDGKLFVGNGDGAFYGSTDILAMRSQNLDSMAGKIFRINDDGTAPTDNPFYDGTDSSRSKVWAYGFRNPFRFSIHPITGEPFVGDVGWNTWEEVNRATRGANFGWPCFEGAARQPQYSAAFPACAALQPAQVTSPLIVWDHSIGSSVTGGPFYTGTAYPQLYHGNYFFADYTGHWINRAAADVQGNLTSVTNFATNVRTPVSLELGPDGLLYYIAFETGEIRRIRFNGATAAASATPLSGYSPLSVSFSSQGSTAPSGTQLTYLWNFGDGGTSTEANPVHVYATSAVTTFLATLTVTGGGSSSTATVNVTVGSSPPVPVISVPANGTAFLPGAVVSYNGFATDPDDGALPETALKWTILLHHNTHVHTVIGASGSQGTFETEFHGAGTFSYELILTATDSSGVSATTSVLLPQLVDSLPPTAPGTPIATVAGAQITLGWSPAKDNAGVASYELERCQGAGCGNFSVIATPSTTTYVDLALPMTAYRYRVRALDTSNNAGNYSSVTDVITGAGGLLGQLTHPTGTQNLSTLGTLDWAHWGFSGPTSYNHKAGVSPQISNVTVLGTLVQNYINHPFGFSWSNGTPTGAVTGSPTGLFISGQNKGFRITVPADTVPRTLRVFVGVWRAQGKLVAHLSDGSAPDYVSTALDNATSETGGLYTLTYQATSPGQTLTVTFTQNTVTSGNVSLQAAALTPLTTVPDFSISMTPATQTVTQGGGTSYTVAVNPINGFSGDVTLTSSGFPVGAAGTFSSPTVVGGTGSSTLTVTTSASTPLGSPTLTITGTSAALSHTATGTLQVQAAPDFTISATPATQVVIPGTGASYTVSISALHAFAGNVALSAAGLPAGATGTFNPAIVSGGTGTSTLTVTTSAGTPLGSPTITITGTAGALTHTASVTLAVSQVAAGALASTLSTPSGPQNLSTLGTVDWAHWGLSSAISYNHKSGVAPQISNVTVLGTPVQSYTNHPFGFSWSNGTPTGAVTGSSTGLFISGQNKGFRITVPADTAPRTLQVFVGVWRAQGKLVAQLSDGSAPDYVSTALDNGVSETAGLYTLTYQAASPGQTLTVTFTQNTATSGNISLQAAALTMPDFSLTASPAIQLVTPGATKTYAISVAVASGLAGNVALSAAGLPAGATGTFNPAIVSGGTGTSTLTVATSASTPLGSATITITGTAGAVTHTASVTLAVSQVAAGALASTLSTPSGTQNLSTLGTVDWAHWGLSSATSYNHKSGVSPQISNVTVLGTPVQGYTNHPFGFSWSNGTPTGAVTGSSTGLFISGQSKGFRITVPADTVPRTLQVFVGVWRAQGKLVAQLSDGSAPDYVSTALDNGVSETAGLYTLTYQAASPGQTLTVTFTQNTATSGNVSLQAAALTLTTVPDFNISVAPATQTVTPGAGTSYSVSVNPINGFAGDVTLTSSGFPVGAAGTFSVPTVVGGTGSSTLTVTTSASTPLGSPTLTITGTSAALSHTATGTLQVQAAPDFTMSATPATQVVIPGTGASYTVSISALHAFAGDVALSAAGLPAGATGTFNPAIVSGGTGTSTLTVATSASTPLGSPSLTITGTAAALSHTATATLQVQAAPDFTMSATPATQVVIPGTGASYTVSISALHAFAGNVALSAAGLPAGATGTFNPAIVSGGTGTSTLTVATSASHAARIADHHDYGDGRGAHSHRQRDARRQSGGRGRAREHAQHALRSAESLHAGNCRLGALGFEFGDQLQP